MPRRSHLRLMGRPRGPQQLVPRGNPQRPSRIHREAPRRAGPAGVPGRPRAGGCSAASATAAASRCSGSTCATTATPTPRTRPSPATSSATSRPAGSPTRWTAAPRRGRSFRRTCRSAWWCRTARPSRPSPTTCRARAGGREAELAWVLREVARRRVRNVVWLTARCPLLRRAPLLARPRGLQGLRPVPGGSGPLTAGAFEPCALDPTCGPKAVFVHAPTTQNSSSAQGFSTSASCTSTAAAETCATPRASPGGPRPCTRRAADPAETPRTRGSARLAPDNTNPHKEKHRRD